jgi:hypothetical protein
MPPNLFLSQDTFICWLVAWADTAWASEDSALNSLGLSFVNRLLEMHGVPQRNPPLTVQVHRQLMRADVVVDVGDHLVILIEDKVHAGLHGDQLSRYRLKKKEKFPEKHIVCIFLKTGDQSST